MLVYKDQYGILRELVETGYQTIHTKDINDTNVDTIFKNIVAILSDGIDDESNHTMKVHVVFADGPECTLSIFDFMFNIMFWCLTTCSGRQITSKNLFFEDAITKSTIKKYVDNNFIKLNMKTMPIMELNQNIDRAIGKFRELINFQMYLANTINLKDTIDLMRQYKEFADTIHFNTDNIPLEDIKDKGMAAMRLQANYIKNSDHCLRDALIAGEGVNMKQYKEVAVNIGTKPDGLGSVYPNPIKGSFINGGLRSVEEIVIESSIGRLAQILKKQNVGDSGAFARNLGLNNLDSFLHVDPEFSCFTKNLQSVEIKNSDILDMYNLRYYRFIQDGPEYLLNSETDKHLIGQTLLFRSPMTCDSAARGHGICYRCYGDLAYVNNDINIGQIAAEILSAIYTQILLSAKHLLESIIVKLEWVGGFADLFTVQFNLIGLKDEVNYRGLTILIDPDDIIDNESDDDDDDGIVMASTSYITSFIIRQADGTETEIRTTNADEMYLHSDLQSFMESVGVNDDGIYELDMNKMKDMSLFEMDVKNDELSKTMKLIMNIIDNKTSIKNYNRNTILQAFIDNNLSGGIKLNAVHFEVLLMNQIRHAEDILLLPDWSHENEPCQILTLNNALNNNRSISIRLQSSNLARNLKHPSNRKLSKASIMDLYAMEKPQEYMSSQMPLSEYTLIDNGPVSKKNPIYFFNTSEETIDTEEDESSDDI